VSKNTALTTLYVYNNPHLTTLNLQGATALQDLRCYNDPKLKGLDVSGNSDLRNLWIKDSSYTGTDLVWLKMGAHPNLSNSSSYFKNATSTITIGEVEETFNLKEMYPEIELDRITNMTGADIDLTTGEVSNYQDYDGTQLITYTYRSGTIQGTKGASLTVQLSIEPDALPQGQEIVVVQGVVPNPADGIANKDLLKEGATYEWEGGAPDTSEVSVVTGNIIVRYPDGSHHKVENVRVNVGIDINEENFPDEEFRSYIEGSFDKNQDGVLASTELDVITEINVNNKTNLTSLKGIEHLKNVTHIYANNTSLEVLDVSKNTALTNLNVNNNPNLTTLNVQGASALKVLFCYDNPQLRGLDVSQNTELMNLNVRPSSNKGTNLAWLHVGNNPNLSTISSTSMNINISSTIDIDTYDKNFKLTEAFPGIDPSKIISINGGTVDKGTGVIVRGDSATVEYAYDSGIKSENGTVVLNVTLRFPIEEVIEYTPKGQDITAFRGEEPNAADGIANKNELPEGTTYAWAETPDTSREGTVQGTILVMYPDGTTATVDININVIVGNAETYEPIGQNLDVYRGEEPNAADGIANKDDLPQSTRYEWKQKPDTSTEGRVQATIVVTYSDGSSEEVRIVINVLVKDVDKYTPEGKDLNVYRGETPNAADGIANKGALPGATKYEWKQTPNTSTEGTVQGTIVVSYPDGTSEEVTININVILRDVDKYTPQGQDLTVYRGETPNAADGIANKGDLPQGTTYAWESTPDTS
ncbi:MAG: hypothetical protein K2F55_04575, partial [Erysipelotrichaceae bacterium]|nr:hypothetical protein [Erysipelotrichaceae bacterium]